MKTLLIILFAFQLQAQVLDTSCTSLSGIVYEDNCVFTPLIPPVLSGQVVDRCYTFQPQNITDLFSYIYVVATCPPIVPYAWLNFTVYNATCDTLIQQGQIYPTPTNDIVSFTPGLTYIICYQWKAMCNQSQMCPVITAQLSIYNNQDQATEEKTKYQQDYKYYNIMGVQVNKPIKGELYIKKSPYKTIKEVVK